jgi:rhodanese-related sulfurtransferase
VLAFLFNFQNPKGIAFFPLPRPVDAISIEEQEARRLLAVENALLIDARPREFYELGHVKEAINIPPALFDAVYKTRFQDEDLDRPLIIYGRSISRLWDETLARSFLNHDHERVYLFEKKIKNPLGLEGER